MPSKSKFVEKLVRKYRLRPGKDIRNFIDEEAAKHPISPHGSFTIKGVHNGNYYRIKVPAAPEKQKRRFLPDIPKIPQTHMAKPKSFTKLPPIGSTATSTTNTAASTGRTESASGTSTTVAKDSTSHTTSLSSGSKASGSRMGDDFGSRLWEWWKDNWAVLVLNIGSVCSLIGFTRSDVLELRAFSTAGSATSLVYHFSLSPRRMAPIIWSAIFAVVNSWKIYEVISEREGTVKFTKEEEQVYSKFFMPHGVTPRQFEHLYKHAEIVHVKKGETVVHERQEMNHVSLVIQGETRAQTLGRRLTAASFKVADPSDLPEDSAVDGGPDRLSWTSGAWIGEMAFLESYWKNSSHSTNNGNGSPASSSTTTSSVSQDRNTSTSSNKPTQSHAKSEQQTATSKSTPAATPETVASLYNQQHPSYTPATPQEAAPPPPRRVMSRRRTNALKRSSAMSSKQALYTIVAVQDSVLMRWKHEDMEKILAKSSDLRGAMTRAMTAAIVGKVINFTVSRRAFEKPHNWTNWLRDWSPVTRDGARVQVEKDAAALAAAAVVEQGVVLSVDDDDTAESPPGGPIKKFGHDRTSA